MTGALSITKAQRDTIHDLVLAHLECIGGLRYVIEREDFVSAESMGLEFGADLRLMEDLGWGPSGHQTLPKPRAGTSREFSRAMRFPGTAKDALAPCLHAILTS